MHDLPWTVYADEKLVCDSFPGPCILRLSSNNILFVIFSTEKKNKNQTTSRCSLFKLIASSSTDIFSNTNHFKIWILFSTHSHYTIYFLCTTILLFFSFLLHPRTNLLTQICCFRSRVVTVICIAYFSLGVNFLAFVWVVRMGAVFIRLTCNLGYLFRILNSSHLWSWKIFYIWAEE